MRVYILDADANRYKNLYFGLGWTRLRTAATRTNTPPGGE